MIVRGFNTIPLLLTLILLNSPLCAQDRYFGSFDGTWDDPSAWEGGIVPGAGENAFLVRPYMEELPVSQPIFVFYRSATDPQLSGLVIESSNWLTQDADPGFDVLSSVFQTIGGYDGTITGLHVQEDNPGIRSTHIQNGGTNNVATFLTMGQIEGSGGRYRLNGGELNSGFTVVGESGVGRMVHTGGTHTAGEVLLGLDPTGSGSMLFNGGVLNTDNRFVVGGQGYGYVDHTGDAEATVGSLFLGVSDGGYGEYDFTSTEALQVLGDLHVRRGLFRQILGDVETGNNLEVQSGGRYEMLSVTADHPVGGGVIVAGEFYLNGGNLDVANNTSVRGSGLFDHRRGHHQVGQDLLLGSAPSETASYEFSGGTLVVDRDVKVGTASGGGSFVHNGDADATIGRDLILGTTTSSGQYDFDSSVQLNVTRNTEINQGVFRQISGDVQTGGHLVIAESGGYEMLAGANGLTVGGSIDSSGTFEMATGNLNVAGDTYVQVGTFEQNGGDHTVGGNLKIGTVNAERADYYLRGVAGNRLTVNTNEYIGSQGLGTFYQEEGTHYVEDALVLGYEANFEFTPPLIFDEKGVGRYVQDGGTLTVGRMHMADNGRAAGFDISSFELNAGEVLSRAEIVLGNAWFIMNDGQLTSSRLPGAHHLTEYYGENALIVGGNALGNTDADSLAYTAFFDQNGGYNLIQGNLTIGAHIYSDGRYRLFDGNLDVLGEMTIQADVEGTSGEYLQTGGIAYVRDGVYNNGLMDVSAGSFDTDGFLDNQGTLVVGRGATVTDETGVRTSEGTLYNHGTVIIEGDGQKTIEGGVENFSEMQVNSTAITFTDTVINHDRLLSNDSEITLENLTIGETGYLKSSADQFIIQGDFENDSQQAELWDTSRSALKFDGAVAHLFGLAGADEGATVSGFADNFMWGELELASNQTLTLLDADMDGDAALYIGILGLQDTSELDSIFSDFNIYYDETLSENAYLNGQTFSLNGAGLLIPVAVPEPTGVVLVWICCAILSTRRIRIRGSRQSLVD